MNQKLEKTSQYHLLILRMANRISVLHDSEPLLHTSIGTITDTDRSGLTWEKAERFFSMPFNPKTTKAFREYKRITDLQIEDIRDQILAVAIDIDGTIVPYESTEVTEEVATLILEIKNRFKAVCFYSNNPNHRDYFGGLPVSVAKHVPAKPDPQGFEAVRGLYLGDAPPHACAMIGDNYVTDGGCREAGWKYIHVNPVPGKEGIFHKSARGIGSAVAKTHKLLFQK